MQTYKKKKRSTLIHKLLYSYACKLSSTHAGRSPLFSYEWGSMHMVYKTGTGSGGDGWAFQRSSPLQNLVKWKSVIISWTMQNSSTTCHQTHTSYHHKKTKIGVKITDLPSQLSGIHRNCEQLLQCALEPLL